MMFNLIEREKIYYKIELLIGICLIILGISTCISEAMNRNAVRVVLCLSVIAFLMYPQKVSQLRYFKTVISAIAIFFAMRILGAWYGGNLSYIMHTSDYFQNYSALLIPVVICFCKKKYIEYIINSTFLSLLIIDFYVFWQHSHGVGRPIGVIVGTMGTTIFYVILLPLILLKVMQVDEKLWKRALYAELLILSIIALLFMQTRGAWCAIAVIFVGITYGMMPNKKKFFLAMGAGLIFLSGMFISTPKLDTRLSTVGNVQEHSQAQRLLFYQSATNMFLDHPIFGVGTGNYKHLYQTQYRLAAADENNITHAHSNYFEILAENGIVGIAIYLSVCTYLLYWTYKQRTYFYGKMMLAMTTSLLLYSFSDYTLTFFIAMRLYWLLLGCCLAGIMWERTIHA